MKAQWNDAEKQTHDGLGQGKPQSSSGIASGEGQG